MSEEPIAHPDEGIDLDTVSQREYFENVAAYQGRLFDTSSAYNQVVVLAGYAGFFGIWSSLADEFPRWLAHLAGGLMVVSLIIYVGWTVLGMALLRTQIDRMMRAIVQGPEGFHARVTAAEAEGVKQAQGIMRHWAKVVYLSGGAALAAALLVGVAAFINVIN